MIRPSEVVTSAPPASIRVPSDFERVALDVADPAAALLGLEEPEVDLVSGVRAVHAADGHDRGHVAGVLLDNRRHDLVEGLPELRVGFRREVLAAAVGGGALEQVLVALEADREGHDVLLVERRAVAHGGVAVLVVQVLGDVVQVVRPVVVVVVTGAVIVAVPVLPAEPAARAGMVAVLVADDVAVDVGRVVEPVVAVLGRLAVGHEDDVVLLAALLHGRGVGAPRVEPARHPGEVEARLGQGLRERRPPVRAGVVDGAENARFT